jgi:hypothetical protein
MCIGIVGLSVGKVTEDQPIKELVYDSEKCVLTVSNPNIAMKTGTS